MDYTTIRWTIQSGMLCLLGAGLVSGCVTANKYQDEKTRSLNYQRLLSQEEQRTSELNAQLQEAKQELSSLELQNDELSIELDALREQVNSGQGRAPGLSSDVSDSPAASQEPLASDPSLSEFELNDFSFDESDFGDFGMEKAEAGADSSEASDLSDSSVSDSSDLSGDLSGSATYYTVVQGDTLYRISREYGVTVEQLKTWNNLSSNLIFIDQRLIVAP